jgi:glycerol-3-phosphate dehydrogenase
MGGWPEKTRFKPARQVNNLPLQSFGAHLRPEFKKGFLYSDAWGDDTRLVVMNAVDAAENGADIRTRTICTGLKPRAVRGLSHCMTAGRGRMQCEGVLRD